MNETLKKYYEYLRGAGADAPGTFESFSSTLEDPQNSEKYFNYLQSSGFDTPNSYDAFVTTLGLKKKDEPTASPSIQEDIYGVSHMPADYLQQPSEEKPKEDKAPAQPTPSESPLNYEDTLPDSFMPGSYIASAERKNKYYEQRGRAIMDKFEADVKALEASLDTTEDPKGDFEKLKDKALADIKKLEGDFDAYQWIDKDHVKQIQDEVLNIIQLPGTTTEQKHAALNELKQYFVNAYTSSGADPKAVEGEINDIIGRRAMFTGSQPTTFALKSQALEVKEKLRVAREEIIKELESVQPTYTAEGIAVPKAGVPASKYDDLQRSLRKLELAEKNLSTAMRMPEASKGAGVEAFRQELANIASVGVAGLAEVLETTGSAKKQREGTATEVDEALVDSYGQLQQLRGIAQEEVDRYRRASSIAGSIPYMEQFILTGGIGRVAVGTAEKAVASVLKNRVKSAVMRGLAERTIAPVVEGAISTIGRVPLSPATYKNIAEMRLPLKQENGKYVIDPAALPNMAKAIAVGTGRSAAEIFSESLGGVVALPKWKAINRIISPSAQRIFKTVGLNNPFGEYTEEFFSNWLQGEAVFKDPEFLKDLALTIPVMTAGFAVMASPEVAKDMMWRSDAKAVIDKFGRENIADLRNMIEAKDEAGIIKKIVELSADANGKQLTKLIEYTGSLVQNKVVDEMTAGEQKTTETGGVKDAESVRVKTEETGAEAAPGMVEGEKERVDLRGAAEDRVGAEPRKITVERTEEGDTMAMAAPLQAPPTPEVKQQVKDEIARLNALSKGQKIIAIDDGATGVINKRVMDEFAAKPGMRALHIKGDNRSYIHLGRINSVEDARRAWLHEAGVHGGIERLFSTKEEYVANMLGVVKNLGGREAALDAIAELGGNREGYRSNTDAMVGEEYLAFLSRKVITDPNLNAEKVLAPQELSAWKKFIKAISDAVAKFMGTPLKLTDADVANLIIDSTRTAISERGGKMDTVFARRGTTEQSEMLAEEAIETPQGTKVIVAPFYDTKIKSIEEAAKLRESEPYKRQQQQIKDVAEIMGVKIKDISENIGGFVNEQGDKIIEVSNTITIDGTIEQAEAFAAVMGAMSQEAQEATIAGVYVEAGSESHGIDEMSIPVGDINGAIEALDAAGITDYTINETESTVQILDFSKGGDAEFGNKITNFVNALSEKGITYGKQTRRAVDSRYIDPDTRRDILGRISQDPIYQRQGGAGFRTLIERAQARDQDFRSRTRGESRGEVTTEENLRNIVKSLGLTFPDLPILVIENKEQGREMLSKFLADVGTSEQYIPSLVDRMLTKTRGNAVLVRGRPVGIVLNKKYARAQTLGHEAWHVLLNTAFGSNQELFRKFATEINSVLRDSGMSDIAEALEDFALGYEGDDAYEEYLAELGGALTASNIDINNLKREEQSFIDKIKEIFNKFARALVGKDLFLKDATPENILDFMIAISQRMAKGESVADFLIEGQALPSAEGVAARRQSISVMKGEESMKKYGLDKGKNTVRRVGEALEARQRAKYGVIKKNDRSEAAERKIASWMVKEISYWVDLCEREGINSGRGWYGKLFQESLDIFAEAFPRLKSDQNARDMFTMLLAITSDGQKIMQNFKLAAQAYQQWEKTGRVPDKLPALRTASIISNLANLNGMLIEHGGDVAKMKETLLRIQPVKEINKELRRRGMSSMSWPADFKVPVASGIFGPKLGMYFANLSGVENYPTLDRWWSRMFNRYRGTLVPEVTKGLDAKGNAMGLDRLRELMGNPEMTDEEAINAAVSFRNTYAAKGFKNGTEIEKAANTIYKDAFETLNDAPFNTSDRGFMYRALKRAVKNINRQGFDFTIADAQAALWYYEKNLYKQLGVKANIEGISYADAARESVRKFHEAGDKFTYAIKKSEDVSSVENADNDIDADEIVIRSQLITPLESPEIKRIKSHIRKMVLQAHGVDIMEKRAQAAYDIGAAEERLIRNIEEGKDKAAKKRAIETYRQLSKFISRAIKEAAFATKLSRVQTRMIVNEARRVKDLDSLQDFFATLDKIVDNTQYAAAMNSARTAQREIRKRVASGRYGKDAQMVLDFATMPLRVRDFEMEDLEEFNKVAELLLAGKVPADGVTALRSYKPPQITEPLKVGLRKMINEMDGPEDFEKVYDAISGLDVSSLNKLERALGAVSMARERLSEMSGEESDLGEMEDRLDDLELQLENRATEFAEELEEEKLALIEESKTLAEDVELESFYPEERIEVKKILEMREDELMRMTPKQVFLYRDIVHGLTEGFVNKEMYMFIQEMDVTLKRASWDVITAHLQNGYKKIRELGDKFAKANMRFIAKWIDPLRINEDFLTNVFNLSKMNVVDQKVLGIYDKNVKPIYENFIAPLMRAVTTMDRDVEQAMNQYYAATKRVSKEEREMLGMLMAERDFRSGSIIIGGQEYTWDELPPEEKKDLFRWAAENRSKSMHHDVMDIMRVRKEMVLDEQGNIDIDASLDKMVKKNPAVAKLMAAARTIIDSQKGKARVAAEMRGDVFEDEGPDYFPRLVAESLNRQDPKMIEKGNIDSMTSPYRAVRKRAKSSFNRTHERHATEYDLDRVIGFYIYDVNRDYHLSRPITAISVALHRVAATSEVEDSAQVAAALRRSIVDRIKVELAERSKIPVLSKLVNWKRTLALAQPERPMIEFTANAIRYYAENPSARVGRMTDPRWKTVAKLMASPISLKRLSRYDSELMTEEREGFLERGAKLLYTAADTYAGRLVYGNEFDKAFKEKTGEKFDVDKFIADEQYRIDNKEALAHADAMAMNMIESLYNSQSWATGPSQHRYLPGTTSKEMLSSKKSFIAQTLGYMQSFNFGETEEALNAIRAIARPGVSSDAKARAGRRLLNLMVTNYVYMAIRGMFFVMLNSAIDDEDDFMESLANYFSLKNQSKMFVGSVATLGMGRHGALVRLATSVFLGFADYANEDSESLRLIVDTANQSINARPINPNKRMKFVDFVDQVGMIWGDIAADLARMGMSAVDLYKQVSEEGIDSLTLDQKETWVALSAVNQMLALAVPNFVSPVAERVIRAFRYSVGPDYQVDPDKKARTVNGTDIKDLYKLAPVSGMTSKAITIYSTGERMENKREISDGELKKYQSLAREKFDAYVREYTVNNRGVIAAEAQAGTVSDARSDEVQKDINELWKRAKKQAQIELYEYPSAKRHSEYSRVVKYGALPEPISKAERTVDGERVNMMMDPALAKEVNKTFIRLYLEWFSSHYATEAAVKSDKRDIQENGKSKFDNDVNEAVKKLRAEAKSQHLK